MATQRIVLKFGSGILTRPKGNALDEGQFKKLADAVAGLVKGGAQCIIVSSGAVAAGMPVLGLKERPADLTTRQACAAAGQSRLMGLYSEKFAAHGLRVAQLLLTHGDLDSRMRRENAGNTLECLLARGNVVPVVNENDSVAVEELRFGDNDHLSAEVATLAAARSADHPDQRGWVDGFQWESGPAGAGHRGGGGSGARGEGETLRRGDGDEAGGGADGGGGGDHDSDRQWAEGGHDRSDSRGERRGNEVLIRGLTRICADFFQGGGAFTFPGKGSNSELGGIGAMTDLKDLILEYGQRARQAARALARLSTDQKNAALCAMADQLVARTEGIQEANRADLEKAANTGLTSSMMERLALNPKRVQAMADGVRQVAALEDPVGTVLKEWTRPNGLRISKVRVPIGVIGIIYESRPNVTCDAAVLCTKTGNATILRGGSESIQSNLAIAEALQAGAAEAGLPGDSVLLIPRTDRDAVKHMAEMDKYIDLIVPRGGHRLIETVMEYARMPVIKHYHGVCITYVDKDAELEMAVDVVVNAKTQRPGVCNALETVLVHRGDRGGVFREGSLAARGEESRGARG